MKKKRLLSLVLILVILTQIIPSNVIGVDISSTILEDKTEEVEIERELDGEEELENKEVEEKEEVKDSIGREIYIENNKDICIIDRDKDIREQMLEAEENGQNVLFEDMTIEDELIEINEDIEVEFNKVTLNNSSLKVNKDGSLNLIDTDFKGNYEDEYTIFVDKGDIRMGTVSISESKLPISIESSPGKINKINGLKLEENINEVPLLTIFAASAYVNLELSNTEIKNNKNNSIEGRDVKFDIEGITIEDEDDEDIVEIENKRLGLFFDNSIEDKTTLKEMESSITNYIVDVNKAPEEFNRFENILVTLRDFEFTGKSREYVEAIFYVENSEISFINGEFNNISRIEIFNIKAISDKDDLDFIKNVKIKGYKAYEGSLMGIFDYSGPDKKFRTLVIDELSMTDNNLGVESRALLEIKGEANLIIKDSEFLKNTVGPFGEEEFGEDLTIIDLEKVAFDKPDIFVDIRDIKMNNNKGINSGISLVDYNVNILNSEFIGNTIKIDYDNKFIRVESYGGDKVYFNLKDSKFENNKLEIYESEGYEDISLLDLINMNSKISNVDIIDNLINSLLVAENGYTDMENVYISKNEMRDMFVLELIDESQNTETSNMKIKNSKIVGNEMGSMFIIETNNEDITDVINSTIVDNVMNQLLKDMGDEEDEAHLNIKNTIIYNNKDMTGRIDEEDLDKIIAIRPYDNAYNNLVGQMIGFNRGIQRKLEESKLYYKLEDINTALEMLEEVDALIVDLDADKLPNIVEKLKLAVDYFVNMEELKTPVNIDELQAVELIERLNYIYSFESISSIDNGPGVVMLDFIIAFEDEIFEKYEGKEYLIDEILELAGGERRTDPVSFYHSLFNNKFHEKFNSIEDFGKDELNNIKDKVVLLDANYIPVKGSVVIDKGNNEYVTSDMEYDFTGRNSKDRVKRVVNEIVDIGAHEYVEKIDKPEEKPSIDPGTPTIPSFPSVPGEKPKPQPPIMSEDHIAYIEGYEDNTVRPNAHISREEMSAMLFRLLNKDYRNGIRSDNNNFSDLDRNRWSNKHISTLAKGNLVLGYPDGTFRPVANLTRAEAAVLIYRFGQVELDEKDKVKDIKLNDISGHWAEEDIMKAVERGWIDGYPDGSFKPSQNITRAEMVTLINRMLNRHTKTENMFSDRKTYKDLTEKEWYYEAFEEAINGHEYDRLKDNTEKWTERLNNIEM